MKKLFPVVIIALFTLSIYSCKKESTTTTTTTVTVHPADSFAGTWNAIDTSYYFTVPTDFGNFNFSIVKTDSNKVSFIGFPTSGDTTHGTVTANSIVTDDTTLTIHVINYRSWTYRRDLNTFGPGNYYFIGKATKQ